MKFKMHTLKRVACTIGVAAAMVSFTSQSQALTEDGLLVRGGQLYDWFYKISEGDVPKKTHASMPEAAGKTGKKTWRCSTCHGFGYAGDLGLPGIAAGKSSDDAIAIIKDAKHNYTADIFTEEDFNSLGIFVSKGIVDVSKLKGNTTKGQGYYETICAVCHGADGKKITDMAPVGAVVNKLPERSLHRIRFGKPTVDMPAMASLPLDVSVDIWEYTKTLPQE